jgi:hypothetical protein
LVDRLRCADSVQHRRAIRGDNDHWHKSEIRFGDARVQFGGSRATGHHDNDWPLRNECTPESEEPGAAFVQTHVHGQLFPRCRSQR